MEYRATTSPSADLPGTLEAASTYRSSTTADSTIDPVSTVSYVPLSDLQILDRRKDEDGYLQLRILIEEKRVVHVTLKSEMRNSLDISLVDLLRELPTFPVGDWVCGDIRQNPNRSELYFTERYQGKLPSITALWHTRTLDISYFSIQGLANIRSTSHYQNMMMRRNITDRSVRNATHPELGAVIIKFNTGKDADDMDDLNRETEAYGWIEGHQIGPEFLGHLSQEGRVIGFILERIEGRLATRSDIVACKALMGRLHGLGIVHNDAHGNNFIVSDRVVLIDFECAREVVSEEDIKDDRVELLA